MTLKITKLREIEKIGGSPVWLIPRVLRRATSSHTLLCEKHDSIFEVEVPHRVFEETLKTEELEQGAGALALYVEVQSS